MAPAPEIAGARNVRDRSASRVLENNHRLGRRSFLPELKHRDVAGLRSDQTELSSHVQLGLSLKNVTRLVDQGFFEFRPWSQATLALDNPLREPLEIGEN